MNGILGPSLQEGQAISSTGDRGTRDQGTTDNRTTGLQDHGTTDHKSKEDKGRRRQGDTGKRRNGQRSFKVRGARFNLKAGGRPYHYGLLTTGPQDYKTTGPLSIVRREGTSRISESENRRIGETERGGNGERLFEVRCSRCKVQLQPRTLNLKFRMA